MSIDKRKNISYNIDNVSETIILSNVSIYKGELIMYNISINIGGNIFNGEYEGDVCIIEKNIIPTTHEYLFAFLETDLKTLEQYALSYLECIDFNHPEKSIKGDIKKRRHLFDELSKLHPYYSRNYTNITGDINTAIAKYVKNHIPTEIKASMSDEHYISLLSLVCTPDYAGSVDMDSLKDIFVNDFTANSIFNDLINYQKYLNRMVFMLFDCTNREMVMPSVAQRAALYCSLFHDEYNPLLSYKVEKTFTKPQSLRQITAAFDFINAGDETEAMNIFDDIKKLMDDPTADMPESLMSLVVAASQIKEDCLLETVVVDSISGLLNYEVFGMIEQNTHIKRCKHCGRYFIIDKLNLEYCDRIMPGELKPCNEIGKTRTYQNKLENDELMAMYRRAYKTHFARIRAGKMTQESFKEWSTEASNKLEKVRDGNLNTDEYSTWLKI